MDLYSPNAKKVILFKKNTLKIHDSTNQCYHYTESYINNKASVNSSYTNNRENKTPLTKRPLQRVSLVEHLKMVFYERMRIFFDYEERCKEELVENKKI